MLVFYQQLLLWMHYPVRIFTQVKNLYQASLSFISGCMCSAVPCSPSLRWGTGTELK